MARCGGALVGRGTVNSAISFPDQRRARFGSEMLLFNAPGAVLMHVHTTQPLRGTFLVPIRVIRSDPRRGMILKARFPKIAAGYGYLTGFRMVLNRKFLRAGKRQSYLKASCAAPPAFRRVSFELARVTYTFVDGKRLS